jgi:hypothetical protein
LILRKTRFFEKTGFLNICIGRSEYLLNPPHPDFAFSSNIFLDHLIGCWYLWTTKGGLAYYFFVNIKDCLETRPCGNFDFFPRAIAFLKKQLSPQNSGFLKKPEF